MATSSPGPATVAARSIEMASIEELRRQNELEESAVNREAEDALSLQAAGAMTREAVDLIHEVLDAGKKMAAQLEDYIANCGNSPPPCDGCPSCEPDRDALLMWAMACWKLHRALPLHIGT